MRRTGSFYMGRSFFILHPMWIERTLMRFLSHQSTKGVGATFPGIIFAGSMAEKTFPSAFLLKSAFTTSDATSSLLMEPQALVSSVKTPASLGASSVSPPGLMMTNSILPLHALSASSAFSFSKRIG